MVDLSDKKADIDYPTLWVYKVIINSHCKIKHILQNTLGEREYQLKKSNNSKNNTYMSYQVSILVHSDDDRVELYHVIKKEDCVKIVL